MVWGVFVSYNGLAISVYKYSISFYWRFWALCSQMFPWSIFVFKWRKMASISFPDPSTVHWRSGNETSLISSMLYSGNFRGRKLLWISQFCGYSWKFSLRNLASFGTAKATTKLLLVKIIFFNNSWKFSPSKVSRYMVITWEALARMWVRPCLSLFILKQCSCSEIKVTQDTLAWEGGVAGQRTLHLRETELCVLHFFTTDCF